VREHSDFKFGTQVDYSPRFTWGCRGFALCVCLSVHLSICLSGPKKCI